MGRIHRDKVVPQTAINFVVKHDHNVGGYHEDIRVNKKKKDKHKKDLRSLRDE